MTFFQDLAERKGARTRTSHLVALFLLSPETAAARSNTLATVKINAERYPVHGALENQSKSGSAGGAISWLAYGPTCDKWTTPAVLITNALFASALSRCARIRAILLPTRSITTVRSLPWSSDFRRIWLKSFFLLSSEPRIEINIFHFF